MKKLIIFLLLLVLTSLQYPLWFGKGSYAEFDNLQRMIAQQRQENATLKKRNESLAAEVIDLKHANEAVEERARVEFGMVKPGEVFIQIVE